MKLEDIYAEAPVFLKQAQREFYYEKGYLVLPSLIGHNELAALRTAAGKLVDSTRQLTQSPRQIDLEKGHNAKSPRLRRAAYLDDLDPVFWDFCKDSIIPAIAADLLGPNVRFRDLMLNFKWAGGGAAAKWHQDIAFYPHTHSGAMQFLVFLEDVFSDQGPLQVVPGSHQGQIFEHYDDRREWTGAIKDSDIQNAGLNLPLEITGCAGTVSVHRSRTIHGSGQNHSQRGRQALVITYSAADAVPYTAPAYPSSHYGRIVRGAEPGYAHHEELYIPMPPDWSGGYTSIFDQQEDNA